MYVGWKAIIKSGKEILHSWIALLHYYPYYYYLSWCGKHWLMITRMLYLVRANWIEHSFYEIIIEYICYDFIINENIYLTRYKSARWVITIISNSSIIKFIRFAVFFDAKTQKWRNPWKSACNNSEITCTVKQYTNRALLSNDIVLRLDR